MLRNTKVKKTQSFPPIEMGITDFIAQLRSCLPEYHRVDNEIMLHVKSVCKLLGDNEGVITAYFNFHGHFLHQDTTFTNDFHANGLISFNHFLVYCIHKQYSNQRCRNFLQKFNAMITHLLTDANSGDTQGDSSEYTASFETSSCSHRHRSPSWQSQNVPAYRLLLSLDYSSGNNGDAFF